MKQQEYIEAVLSVCRYINVHYMENLSLEEVAAVSGFSKFHFTRIFKQYMNMTFYEYLNSKRVKRAEELLYDKKDEYHGCGDEFRILFFKCLQPYLQDGKGLFAERLPQTAGVDGTGFADAGIKGLVFHTLLC